MPRMEFGSWMPDLPDNENPGAILAKNVIPAAKSYKEIRNISASTSALATAPKGVFWARSSTDAVFVFAGDTTKLYLLVGTTWTDVSKPATTYSVSYWDFSVFGNRVLATDGGGHVIQYYDMGTSATFLDLPGSPPQCKVLGVVRDFLLAGNITADPTLKQDGIAWSGFNNTELWTPSRATQSDRQPLRGDGGRVQRIVSGETGVIFQEKSIQRLTYVGPPTVFRIDEFITRHGTLAPRSVAATKDYIFYYSTDGFYKLDRSTFAVTPIGAERVNDFFIAAIPPSEVSNIIGTVGRLRNKVYWIFRTSVSNPLYDRMLIYNWIVDRWSYAEINTSFIGEFATVGANLDTLDAVLGAGGIDIKSIPVDTDAYAGGAVDVVGFDSTRAAGSFSGTPLVAEIDTAEMSADGQNIYIPKVRPIVDGLGSVVEVAVLTRPTLNVNPIISAYRGLNRVGEACIQSNARYTRYRTRITGGFNHAQRLEYEPTPRGNR